MVYRHTLIGSTGTIIRRQDAHALHAESVISTLVGGT